MSDASTRPGPATSALYVGRVTHRRLHPREHALAYRVFYLLLDLDEVDALARRLRFFSAGARNVASFHERDHGDGTGRLRPQVEAMVRNAGGPEALGAIRLLTMPRLLGYAFNPLSVYFCHGREDRLVCLVYEVNNTFGQRHSYVVPVTGPATGGGIVRQRCPKRFYVSPFLDMDLVYDFAVAPPAERVSVAVTASDGARPVIATAFRGTRVPLTDGTLLRAVASHPLLTAKVVAAIHWEALRIWLKGIGLRTRPPAPRRAITVEAGDE